MFPKFTNLSQNYRVLNTDSHDNDENPGDSRLNHSCQIYFL